MTNKLFSLVLSLMLAVALTACTSGDTNTQTGDGAGDNTTIQNDTARTRTTQQDTQAGRSGSKSSATRGRYFADAKGDVRDDRSDWVGDDVRRAADDMMEGARNMGRKMGDTIEDMTN